MPKLEIHPVSDELRREAAAVLRARHERHRAAEPLLPAIDDFASQLPTGDGAAATRGGEVVAYLIAEVTNERAAVGLAGCAASEPEALRDVYAHLAASWPPRHQVLVPASDAALVDAWFRLAFGCQWVAAARETAAETAPDFGGVVRPSTRDDLAVVAGLEEMLWKLQAGSPSFSGLLADPGGLAREWEGHWDEDAFPLHLVAEVEGRVVGHLLLYDRPAGDLRVPERNVDLALAGTLPEARGRGVGRALTAHALAFAHEHGYRSMTTDWRSVNLLSSRFWPRRGFRPTFLRLYRAMP
ncbi:MAG TPA: GNAT family N-acetyltransferase [Gaiellaceae bacterium]